MKSKRHPNGPGDLAIDNLVDSMVAHLRGSVVKEPDGLRLSIPGDPGGESVRYAPTTPPAWATRLKWVEKQSAIFLLNAPILYAMKWVGGSAGSRGNRCLRLSVGLSLSVGPSLPKRYVCVVTHGSDELNVSEGGYLPLGRGKKLTLTGLPAWAQADLPKLAQALFIACEYFQRRPEVQQAVLQLGRERRAELTNLDHLYRRKHGSNDRLYGLPAPGTEGSGSIEAELRELQSIALQRYAVRVRVRVLTLGVLEGNVPRDINEAEASGSVVLPTPIARKTV